MRKKRYIDIKSYYKEYREKNKEKHKNYIRLYRLKNKEQYIKSNRIWREKNRDKIRIYDEKRRKNPEVRYQKYISGAKVRGYEFSLTIDLFKKIIEGNCYYCGQSDKIGIDRKDNNIGYTELNSLPCCWSCNKFKRSLSFDFFIENCKKIAKHLEQR